MMQRLLPLLLVSAAVMLNIMSAIMLKVAADMERPTLLIVIGFLVLVVFINLLRVVFWSAIHRRFPLSDSYPLTSIFFPMILMISVLYGEHIGLSQLIGTLLITVGVVILVKGRDYKTAQENHVVERRHD